MEISDAAVVAQVLAGDRDAFRLLVDRHTRSIYSVAWRMTGNQQDAEEIVQNTFLRAYRSLHRFELRASFATWLYRIAVNRSLDFLKAKKMTDAHQISHDPRPDDQDREVQVASTHPGPDRLLLSTEARQKINEAIGLLSPAERVAFTMRHMEGRSIEEISKVLNVRASAAKNSIFRAVQKIRQQLGPLGPRSPGIPVSRTPLRQE
jgi:RNA polymerase sigma-70 factor, ECF subfamily